MRYIDELVVISALALSIAFVWQGDNERALTPFLTALAYVFGKTRKLNGDLTEALNKRKK